MNDTYLYGEMFSENILTSYRIYGDRKSLLTPLIILHGGPSGGFDYLLNYRRLADDGRMVRFYDQMAAVVQRIFLMPTRLSGLLRVISVN